MKEFFLPRATGSALFLFLGDPRVLPALWLGFINLLAFSQMGIDKARSKKEGRRRISERSLFLTAALGGSLGAILGMRLFRHKTRHWYFVWGMPAILLAQTALALWLLF